MKRLQRLYKQGARRFRFGTLNGLSAPCPEQQ